MTRDELIEAGMIAFKDNAKLDWTAMGLTWLRVPMERVVDALVPLIEGVSDDAES